MIRVYFGTDIHSELAAIFDDEEVYELCRPLLSGFAKKHRMKLTESITEEKIEKYYETRSEKENRCVPTADG